MLANAFASPSIVVFRSLLFILFFVFISTSAAASNTWEVERALSADSSFQVVRYLYFGHLEPGIDTEDLLHQPVADVKAVINERSSRADLIVQLETAQTLRCVIFSAVVVTTSCEDQIGDSVKIGGALQTVIHPVVSLMTLEPGCEFQKLLGDGCQSNLPTGNRCGYVTMSNSNSFSSGGASLFGVLVSDRVPEGTDPGFIDLGFGVLVSDLTGETLMIGLFECTSPPYLSADG